MKIEVPDELAKLWEQAIKAYQDCKRREIVVPTPEAAMVKAVGPLITLYEAAAGEAGLRDERSKINARLEEARRLFESVPTPSWCAELRATLAGLDENQLHDAKNLLKAHPATFDVVQNKARPQEFRIFVRPFTDGDIISSTNEVRAVLMRLNPSPEEGLKIWPQIEEQPRPKYMTKPD